jgi:hypothetical protein
MHLPQFSLKTLAGIVAFAAVACCSLVYASSTWSATIYTAAIVFLAFATLAAVYSRERVRAYWLACAFCGWLYLLFVFGPLSATQQMVSPGQLNVDSELATTHLARWLYATVLPKLREPLKTTAGATVTLAPGGTSVVEVALDQVAWRLAPDAITLFDVNTGMPVAAGTSLATAPSTVAAYYPDETSFVRVCHALWTWLFALAGGLAGKWLYGSPR